MPTRFATLLALIGHSLLAAPAPAHRKAVTPAECEAVLLALDDYFHGSWNFGTIYLEAGPHLPPGLTKIGKYDAEVVTEADLKKRFEGKEKAPAFARVRVGTETVRGEVRYSVQVIYTGLIVKGAKSIPLGGSKTYFFTGTTAKLKVVETITARE